MDNETSVRADQEEGSSKQKPDIAGGVHVGKDDP